MSQRTAPGIGKYVMPTKIRRITKFIAQVVYKEYGNRNILISKLSPKLKSMMV